MADYAASVFAKAQTILNERFQAAEMRQKPSAVLMTLLKNTNFLIPDIRGLRDREDRATKTYLKNRASRALTNSRTASRSGAVADSTEVDIAFTTYTDGFATSLKRGDNNMFNDATQLAHEMENSIINLHEGIETALVTWLDANKTTASNPPSGALKRATFNGTNDVYEIAGADSDEYWHIMKSIFRQEKYSVGTLDVVTDSLLASTGEFSSQQGQGNSTNLGFQFSGLSVMESIEVNDSNYANGISFAMPTGMTGIIDWIPKQNRQGKGDFDSYLGGFSTMTDPMTGLTFAVHGYTERADTSATNGNTQDEVTQWEISVDLSPQKAPLTAAGESPIFAIGQL
jgi:hypothetical protein